MCSGYVEGMVNKLKSESEALEPENTRLREAICLPDLQVLFDLCVCVCVCVCVWVGGWVCTHVHINVRKCVCVHRRW